MEADRPKPTPSAPSGRDRWSFPSPFVLKLLGLE